MIVFRAINPAEEEMLMQGDRIIARKSIDGTKPIKEQIFDFVQNGSSKQRRSFPFITSSKSSLTMIKFAADSGRTDKSRLKDTDIKRNNTRARVFAIALPVYRADFKDAIWDGQKRESSGIKHSYSKADKEVIIAGSLELKEGEVVVTSINLSAPEPISISSECMFEIHPLLLEALNLMKVSENHKKEAEEIIENIEESIITSNRDSSPYNVKNINKAIDKLIEQGVFNELEIKFIQEYFLNLNTIDDATKTTFQIDEFSPEYRFIGQCLRTEIAKKFIARFLQIEKKDLTNVCGFLEMNEGESKTGKEKPHMMFSEQDSNEIYKYAENENLVVDSIDGNNNYIADLPIGMEMKKEGEIFECIPKCQRIEKEKNGEKPKKEEDFFSNAPILRKKKGFIAPIPQIEELRYYEPILHDELRDDKNLENRKIEKLRDDFLPKELNIKISEFKENIELLGSQEFSKDEKNGLVREMFDNVHLKESEMKRLIENMIGSYVEKMIAYTCDEKQHGKFSDNNVKIKKYEYNTNLVKKIFGDNNYNKDIINGMDEYMNCIFKIARELEIDVNLIISKKVEEVKDKKTRQLRKVKEFKDYIDEKVMESFYRYDAALSALKNELQKTNEDIKNSKGDEEELRNKRKKIKKNIDELTKIGKDSDVMQTELEKMGRNGDDDDER